MGDSTGKSVPEKGDVPPPSSSSLMTSSTSNNSISSLSSTGGGQPSQDTTVGNQSSSNQDMFRVGVRLHLPDTDCVEQFAKFSLGEINCFALALKKSEDLLLLSDHHWSSGLNEAGSQAWCIKRVPWFEDGKKRITALTFDDEGTLYIGTLDGHVIELKALRVLSDQRDSDLNIMYRLLHKIVQILVWNQDSNKILLCVGSFGNLAIISGNSTPVNVSFTASILGVELFRNKSGLTCALVCLETGQNVYLPLDDLDLPSQQNESHAKKSIFRKAKDNLMSRLSEDKLNFFSSKRVKSDGGSINSITNAPPPNVTITTGPPHGNLVQHTHGTGSPDVAAKVTSVTTGSSAASVKFQTLEDFNCRGQLRKVKGRSQFIRHANSKLDIFDDDFRQVSSVFVPSNINSVFVMNRLYFCVDRGASVLRVCLMHNGSLKDIDVIQFKPCILSIETKGESTDASCSVFIIAEDAIYELTLQKEPVYTCVNMLLKETSASLLEAVCNALNVSKTQVCAIAGDIKADEGKFSKSILYYKLAGLTYTEISAKFGSKGLMPAMLFFFELVDQEKTKLYGGFQDKQVMSDLALLGRIEQFLRYGSVRSKEAPRNPTLLVQKMISNNIWFSSRGACEWLSQPELLWGLKMLARARRCHPEVLFGLRQMDEHKLVECLRKRLIWTLLTEDWLSLYSAHALTFVWFREIVQSYIRLVDSSILYKLLLVLLPWRRELQRKIFTEISDSAEVINYAKPMDVPKVMLDDYLELFVVVLLEVLRRAVKVPPLPSFVFKSDARAIQRLEIGNHKTNMVATLMLSFTFQKTLAASMSHVLCVRNGKVYAWGENKFGKLGTSSLSHTEDVRKSERDHDRFQFHIPTPINLPNNLLINIDSVCAGSNHSVALTSVGTLFVWGGNTYGQLGLGSETQWASRPVPLHVPDVIFTCVAAGSYHTVAVDHLNRAWTWGWGVHGQLGNGKVENSYQPQLVDLKEKIVSVSAGHSHTAFLTCFGRVLTTGCDHFGQLALGTNHQKSKVPKMVNGLPVGTLIRIVECGVSSTVMVSTKNRLFYSGLNPASLKSLLNSSRRREKGRAPTEEDSKIEEERDFCEPTMIDTSHMAGDIAKVNCSSTHFAVMSSLGYVYTWGDNRTGKLGFYSSDGPVVYVLNLARFLKSRGMDPILVLEGERYGPKRVAYQRRAGHRRECGLQMDVRDGALVESLIKGCEEEGFGYTTSVYEADAQLAKLAVDGVIDLVLTEDSDLIVYECPYVFYKLDLSTGCGYLYDKSVVELAFDGQYNADLFRKTCLSVQSDYTLGVKGLGFVAAKLLYGNLNPDNDAQEIQFNIWECLPNLEIHAEFLREIEEGEIAFKHHPVFEITSGMIVPLKPYGSPEEAVKAKLVTGDGQESNLRTNLTPEYLRRRKVKFCFVPGTPFKCSRCDASFESRQELSEHLKSHCVCPECGQTFDFPSLMDRHRAVHSKDRPFPCPDCDKRYIHKRNLQQHLPSHAATPRHICEICGAGFSESMSLNYHTMKFHTGEIRWLCEKCGKGFITSGNFKHHQRIHTGEKPFKCRFCGKGFSEQSNMKVHENLHTAETEYRCEICSKPFSCTSNLWSHMKSHSDERPFVCETCDLGRPDDDNKSLELIYSADDKMIIASDICCAGDCTFVVEKESGTLFGCGFNSCGQLGKMESEDDQAVMMIRTKKRVVKVRQPSNIYFKFREIPGLPKQHSWEAESSVMSSHKITPPTSDVNQELLEWVIKAFRRNYDASRMIQNCLKAENFQAASILETMAENHEQALQHNLAGVGENTTGSIEAMKKYLDSIDFTKRPYVEQACRFLTIVITHWSKFRLPGCVLEEVLESHRQAPGWGPCLCSALKEVIALSDESAEWIASNLTPVFILKCINESNKYNPDEEEISYQVSINSRASTNPGCATSTGEIHSGNASSGGGNSGGFTPSSSRFVGEDSSSSSSSIAASSTLNVRNGSLCQSSVSK